MIFLFDFRFLYLKELKLTLHFTFLLKCQLKTRAVHVHGDLLRIGVSTSGNDHRLGAQEAPPAIFTLSVGENFEKHLREAANGGPLDGYGKSARELDIAAQIQPIQTG